MLLQILLSPPKNCKSAAGTDIAIKGAFHVHRYKSGLFKLENGLPVLFLVKLCKILSGPPVRILSVEFFTQLLFCSRFFHGNGSLLFSFMKLSNSRCYLNCRCQKGTFILLFNFAFAWKNYRDIRQDGGV